jgi:hypothetical protein
MKAETEALIGVINAGSSSLKFSFSQDRREPDDGPPRSRTGGDLKLKEKEGRKASQDLMR